MDTDNTQDVLDVRDIIGRYESLQQSIAYFVGKGQRGDDREIAERDTLGTLLNELKGNGGDELWRGDWYPVTLISEYYFETYAEEFAAEIGAIDADALWPLSFIDWEAAADALKLDYSSVDYDGVTYWYR